MVSVIPLHTLTTASPIATQAPAKINLTLEVHNLRGDGYHNLRSLVIGIGLYDRVRCVPLREGGLRFRCDDPLLRGGDNLALRAARRLAAQCGHRPAVELALGKRIPVGADLGGGSSDAAAALRLCDQAWSSGLSRSELAGLGAEVGSDVPLFFALPGAVITGRGEQVKPVRLHWSGWVVLVLAGVAVSTAEVYRAWRPANGAGLVRGSDAAAGAATSAEELAPLLCNHLEPAVFRVAPEVGKVFEALVKLELGPVRVSGAGSAVYILFDDEETAQAAARTIDNQEIGQETLVARAPASEQPIVREE